MPVLQCRGGGGRVGEVTAITWAAQEGRFGVTLKAVGSADSSVQENGATTEVFQEGLLLWEAGWWM